MDSERVFLSAAGFVVVVAVYWWVAHSADNRELNSVRVLSAKQRVLHFLCPCSLARNRLSVS